MTSDALPPGNGGLKVTTREESEVPDLTVISAAGPERIASAIKAARFRYADEIRLQDGIAAVLAGAGIEAEREVPLSPRDKIDFLAGGTGIEVKIAGQPDDVTRQLRRYAESGQVASLVLVTTRARHRSVPREIGGKPVHVVWLSGVTG